MYMMIMLTIFRDYPKETRLSYVKRYYDYISKHKINIPTPIMHGSEHHSVNLHLVFSLMLMTPSIVSLASDMAIGRYVAQRASIGINAGRIRGSTLRSEVERYNTQALSPSLKSLNQLYDVLKRYPRWVCYSSLSYLSTKR